MFEKVNPSHPDKVADRIAGAIVDLAYSKEQNPKIAVEVLIGHGECTIIAEASVSFLFDEIQSIVDRICNQHMKLHLQLVPQDTNLAYNQEDKIRCGDNGVFKGVPITEEQKRLTQAVKDLYEEYPYDGKFIIDGPKMVVCQSNVDSGALANKFMSAIVNPLGEWTGGLDVDTGATNRKLGSDMGDSVTGGGLHGKDLSKADVSVNIYAFILAQTTNSPVELSCAIGDEYIDDVSYDEIVEVAREYIRTIGGFEKFAEWGLIR